MHLSAKYARTGNRWLWSAAAGLIALVTAATSSAAPVTDFRVSLSPAASTAPMTGRLLIAIGQTADPEPRLAIGFNGRPVYGMDISALKPGASVVLNGSAVGYPMPLSALPAGDYYVQAVLERYDQVHREDGHTIWVPIHPMRDTPFTGLQGNLYSDVQRVHIDSRKGFRVSLALTHVIPPPPPPLDTPWIKHVWIKSEILSKFWGTPIYMGAAVLLPKDFDQHPDAHYPAVYALSQGDPPYQFSLTPSSEAEKKKDKEVYNLETGYEFYQDWISPAFPRVAAISLYQPSPYFLEAYAVDSVNNGPWGKAITTELIPYLEKKFRLIPQPYARVVEGASTGGWETLALQLKYPDFFGGAWVFNPDPISFKHWQLVDIYHADNMFSVPVSPFEGEEIPFRRTSEGMTTGTQRQLADLEATLGSHGRSGYQLDIWMDTYGPIGSDGYPVLLFDKLTGKIDHDVANYMRDHGYDLTEYARQNWAMLGPKLRGKLHFVSGEMDNFYLNLGVYDFQGMLNEVAGPDYPADFTYGRPKKGHSWHKTGFDEMIREMGAKIKANAPSASDAAQWNY
ncbi:MAG TPA: alpha/beta hydrolase-fold protein [Rhizomicrobium sp.]|jgi:hypothetical protein